MRVFLTLIVDEPDYGFDLDAFADEVEDAMACTVEDIEVDDSVEEGESPEELN